MSLNLNPIWRTIRSKPPAYFQNIIAFLYGSCLHQDIILLVCSYITNLFYALKLHSFFCCFGAQSKAYSSSREEFYLVFYDPKNIGNNGDGENKNSGGKDSEKIGASFRNLVTTLKKRFFDLVVKTILISGSIEYVVEILKT